MMHAVLRPELLVLHYNTIRYEAGRTTVDLTLFKSRLGSFQSGMSTRVADRVDVLVVSGHTDRRQP